MRRMAAQVDGVAAALDTLETGEGGVAVYGPATAPRSKVDFADLKCKPMLHAQLNRYALIAFETSTSPTLSL